MPRDKRLRIERLIRMCKIEKGSLVISIRNMLNKIDVFEETDMEYRFK